MKYKIWNKQDTLVTPVGEVFTPQQVFAKYPASAVDGIEYIIQDGPIGLAVFMEVQQTKSVMRNNICRLAITDDMTTAEIQEVYDDYDAQSTAEFLYTLEYFDDNQNVEYVTAEERIAAALEMANILALPDVI